MNNGQNDWGVSYSRITFFETILKSHKNVDKFIRTNDIIFTIWRVNQSDCLKALCCDEYVLGLTSVYRAANEFGHLDIIYIGGNWNGYTSQAKGYCIDNKIGLYNAAEINGALWQDLFWNYFLKDQEGNPSYFYRSA